MWHLHRAAHAFCTTWSLAGADSLPELPAAVIVRRMIRFAPGAGFRPGGQADAGLTGGAPGRSARWCAQRALGSAAAALWMTA